MVDLSLFAHPSRIYKLYVTMYKDSRDYHFFFSTSAPIDLFADGVDLDVVRGVARASGLKLVAAKVGNDLASLGILAHAKVVVVNVEDNLGDLRVVGDQRLVGVVELIARVLSRRGHVSILALLASRVSSR